MDDARVISLRGVSKNFPGVIANKDITLEIGHEIHAIVGENGAGKSTLMKVLCGLNRPDAGEIWLSGKRVVFGGPGDAIRAGIGMVHQHFMLVSRFTVLENVILGQEPSIAGVIDLPVAHKRLCELCEKFGFDIDPAAQVSDLSVGQQQRVEILKVLYRGADILILDEPTAVLAPQEVTDLFRNLRSLYDAGKTIIFISHKLDEVLEIAGRISVLRRGELVGTVFAADATRESIAQMMVGRPVLFQTEKPDTKVGPVLLQLNGVTVQGTAGSLAVSGVSLSVRAGEIYGIAGVEGNGQSELILAIAGLRRVIHGSIWMDSANITGMSAKMIRKRGLAHIPEDRHRRGLVLQMSVLENLILGEQRDPDIARNLSIDLSRVTSIAKKSVKEYDIRLSSLLVLAATLSGGNQQKIILSRELRGHPKVIIAAQPMRGLDVGAAGFVRSVLLKAKAQGCAVLLFSADLEDLMSLSDRMGVMYRGQLVAELDPSTTTMTQVGEYMLGPSKGVAE
jgi:general nucleoside transport system ATP-binding protein